MKRYSEVVQGYGIVYVRDGDVAEDPRFQNITGPLDQKSGKWDNSTWPGSLMNLQLKERMDLVFLVPVQNNVTLPREISMCF